MKMFIRVFSSFSFFSSQSSQRSRPFFMLNSVFFLISSSLLLFFCSFLSPSNIRVLNAAPPEQPKHTKLCADPKCQTPLFSTHFTREHRLQHPNFLDADLNVSANVFAVNFSNRPDLMEVATLDDKGPRRGYIMNTFIDQLPFVLFLASALKENSTLYVVDQKDGKLIRELSATSELLMHYKAYAGRLQSEADYTLDTALVASIEQKQQAAKQRESAHDHHYHHHHGHGHSHFHGSHDHDDEHEKGGGHDNHSHGGNEHGKNGGEEEARVETTTGQQQQQQEAAKQLDAVKTAAAEAAAAVNAGGATIEKNQPNASGTTNQVEVPTDQQQQQQQQLKQEQKNVEEKLVAINVVEGQQQQKQEQLANTGNANDSALPPPPASAAADVVVDASKPVVQKKEEMPPQQKQQPQMAAATEANTNSNVVGGQPKVVKIEQAIGPVPIVEVEAAIAAQVEEMPNMANQSNQSSEQAGGSEVRAEQVGVGGDGAKQQIMDQQQLNQNNPNAIGNKNEEGVIIRKVMETGMLQDGQPPLMPILQQQQNEEKIAENVPPSQTTHSAPPPSPPPSTTALPPPPPSALPVLSPIFQDRMPEMFAPPENVLAAANVQLTVEQQQQQQQAAKQFSKDDDKNPPMAQAVPVKSLEEQQVNEVNAAEGISTIPEMRREKQQVDQVQQQGQKPVEMVADPATQKKVEEVPLLLTPKKVPKLNELNNNIDNVVPSIPPSIPPPILEATIETASQVPAQQLMEQQNIENNANNNKVNYCFKDNCPDKLDQLSSDIRQQQPTAAADSTVRRMFLETMATIRAFLPQPLCHFEDTGLIVLAFLIISLILHLTNMLLSKSSGPEPFDHRLLHDCMTRLKEQELIIEQMSAKAIENQRLCEIESAADEQKLIIARLEEELNEQKAERDRLQYSKEVERAERIKMEDELARLRQDLAEKDRESEQREFDRHGLTQQCTKLLQMIEEKDKKVENNEQEREHLRTRLTEVELQLRSLEDDKRGMQHRAKEMEDELARLHQKLVEKDRESEQRELEQHGLTQECMKLLKMVEEEDGENEADEAGKIAAKTVPKFFVEKTRLEEELNKQKTERDRLQYSEEAERAERIKMEDELARLRQDLAEKDRESEQREFDRHGLTQQCTKLLQMIEEKEKKLENCEKERENLRTKLTEVGLQLRSLEDAKREMQHHVKELQQSLKQSDEQKTDFENKLYHENRRWNNRIRQLEEQLNMTKSSIKSSDLNMSGNSSDRDFIPINSRENIPVVEQRNVGRGNGVPSLWSEIDAAEPVSEELVSLNRQADAALRRRRSHRSLRDVDMDNGGTDTMNSSFMSDLVHIGSSGPEERLNSSRFSMASTRTTTRSRAGEIQRTNSQRHQRTRSRSLGRQFACLTGVGVSATNLHKRN